VRRLARGFVHQGTDPPDQTRLPATSVTITDEARDTPVAALIGCKGLQPCRTCDDSSLVRRRPRERQAHNSSLRGHQPVWRQPVRSMTMFGLRCDLNQSAAVGLCSLLSILLVACGAPHADVAPGLPTLVQKAVATTANAPSVHLRGIIRATSPNDAPDSLPSAEYLRVVGVRNRDKSYSETLETFDPRHPTRRLEKDRIRAVRTESGFAVYLEQSGHWSRVPGLGASSDLRFTQLTAGVSTSPNAVLGFLGTLRGQVKAKTTMTDRSTLYTIAADLESMANKEPSAIRRADIHALELSRARRVAVDLLITNRSVARATRHSRLHYPGDRVVTTYSDFYFVIRPTVSLIEAPRLG
jgi:hypothetical protein